MQVTTKTLKVVCGTAYKTDTSKLDNARNWSISDPSEVSKFWDYIWLLCSATGSNDTLGVSKPPGWVGKK